MKGGRKTAWISVGLRSRVRTRKYGPGVEDATVERREAACLARHAGAFTKVPDQDGAPIGAPLPHTCEGKGKGRRRPRAAPTKGAMAHACMTSGVTRLNEGCF